VDATGSLIQEEKLETVNDGGTQGQVINLDNNRLAVYSFCSNIENITLFTTTCGKPGFKGDRDMNTHPSRQ
jgi:hypothetical protein